MGTVSQAKRVSLILILACVNAFSLGQSTASLRPTHGSQQESEALPIQAIYYLRIGTRVGALRELSPKPAILYLLPAVWDKQSKTDKNIKEVSLIMGGVGKPPTGGELRLTTNLLLLKRHWLENSSTKDVATVSFDKKLRRLKVRIDSKPDVNGNGFWSAKGRLTEFHPITNADFVLTFSPDFKNVDGYVKIWTDPKRADSTMSKLVFGGHRIH